MKTKKYLIIIFSLGLALLSGWLVKTNIKPYNITSVLSDDHPARRAYSEHLAKYNDENDVLVLVDSETSLLNGGALFQINSYVSEVFKTINYLKYVKSLVDAEYLVEENQRFYLKRFYQGSQIPKTSLDVLNQSHLFNSVYLAPSGHSIMLYAQIRPGLSGLEKRSLLRTLFSAANHVESKFSGVKVHLLGTEVARFHFMREMIFSQAGILPVVLLIIISIVYFLFRNFRICGLTLYVMGMSYAATVCLIILLEGTISPFSSFALLFIFIIATADLVHFFSAITRQKAPLFQVRVKDAVRDVFKPCFLTSLTTFIGFASLMASSVPPVRYFGLYCCFGILVCFLMTFYGLPFLFKVFSLEFDLNAPQWNRGTSSTFSFVHRFNRGIVFAFIFVTLGLGYLSKNLTMGDNLYNKFVPSHPLSLAVEKFQEDYNFTGSVDVVLKAPRQFFLTSKSEKLQEKLHGLLGALPNVARVRSLYSYQEYIRKLLPEKQDVQKYSYRDEARLNNIFYRLDDLEIFEGYFPHQYEETRLAVYLKSLATEDMLTTSAQISNILKREEFKNSYSASLNGFSDIRAAIYELIFSSFALSFGLSFLGIFIVFWIIFRSLAWAGLAMIPNILPLVAVSGLMGYFDIVVEYNLVVLICIVIGVAVDDTIHFLFHVYKGRKDGQSLSGAVNNSMQQVSRALIGTTLIFVMTLPAFFLTNILLFTQVAAVLIVALLLALVADLLVLPALLMWSSNKEQAQTQTLLRRDSHSEGLSY